MSNGETNTDVILIGAGIMSATLGTMLKELAPDWNIKVFEKLQAQEKKVPTNGTMQELDMLHCASLTIPMKNQTEL